MMTHSTPVQVSPQILREAVLKLSRRAFLECLLRRSRATVDDARGAVELPPEISPSVFTSVPEPFVKLGIIRRRGYIPSDRPEAHARLIASWELLDRDGAQRWLRDNPATSLDEIRSRPVQYSLF